MHMLKMLKENALAVLHLFVAIVYFVTMQAGK